MKIRKNKNTKTIRVSSFFRGCVVCIFACQCQVIRYLPPRRGSGGIAFFCSAPRIFYFCGVGCLLRALSSSGVSHFFFRAFLISRFPPIIRGGPGEMEEGGKPRARQSPPRIPPRPRACLVCGVASTAEGTVAGPRPRGRPVTGTCQCCPRVRRQGGTESLRAHNVCTP